MNFRRHRIVQGTTPIAATRAATACSGRTECERSDHGVDASVAGAVARVVDANI
jgi:hypothetical protein